jgi:hypothetical protein
MQCMHVFCSKLQEARSSSACFATQACKADALIALASQPHPPLTKHDLNAISEPVLQQICNLPNPQSSLAQKRHLNPHRLSFRTALNKYNMRACCPAVKLRAHAKLLYVI